MSEEKGSLDGQFTREAEHTLRLAEEEARRLNHRWIGTEHLLLGMVRVIEERVAVGVLQALRRSFPPGIDGSAVRKKVLEKVPPEPDAGGTAGPALTSRMQRVLERAKKLAADDGRDLAGPGDLILGMFWEAGGVGDYVLGELGITPRTMIDRLVESGALHSPIDPEVMPRQHLGDRYGERVVVADEDLETVLNGLQKLLPPDVPLALNTDPEQGHAWIAASESVDLEDYVRRALADENS